MDQVLNANIFFFITAMAVVVLGLVWLVILLYVVAILRDVRDITRRVRKASNELEQDFESLRAQVKEEGARVRSVFDLFLAFVGRKVRGARKK